MGANDSQNIGSVPITWESRTPSLIKRHLWISMRRREEDGL